MGTHEFYRTCADASSWPIDDTFECAVIVAIGDQSQVSQRILDFSTFEEAQATIDAVRDTGIDQAFLKYPRLGIRAIQHGGVRSQVALANPVTQATNYEI